MNLVKDDKCNRIFYSSPISKRKDEAGYVASVTCYMSSMPKAFERKDVTDFHRKGQSLSSHDMHQKNAQRFY